MAKFIPHFDVQISPNFGYVYTLDDVKRIIEQYETATVSSFVDYRRDGTFGKDANVTTVGKRVCWNTLHRGTSSIGLAGAIKYDGIPYLRVGTKILECHHGKDWKEAQKKRKKEKIKQLPVDANGCVQKKSRKPIQGTKKLDCPARLIVREVIKFPEFKVTDNTESRRKTSSTKLRESLGEPNPPKGERRFYIYLPTSEDHGNTHDTGEDDGVRQRLDKRVIDKIHEVVGSFDVSTVHEMKLIIEMFVKEKLNLDTHEKNRRFFPRDSDIRYHMNMARKALGLGIHANGQDSGVASTFSEGGQRAGKTKGGQKSTKKA
ncbi:calcium-responsive transcription factor-like [Amphiura filiformis]|uniref:calcium-responsive transcription factor-like n=1 Tax=Amphiura filiformis TaxID=82378 RepID=UPI003B227F34